jgi:SAM-dependent methyltransferase
MGAIVLDLPAKGVLTANDEHDPLPFYYKPGVGWLYRYRLTMALDYLRPGGRVLEIGVGSGVLVPTLTRHFDEYVGTDLVLAKGLDHLVRPGCKASFIIADLLDEQSLEANHFDAIVCISVLEHILDSDAAARALARALKPGGTFVAGYPMVNHAMSRAFDVIGFKGIDDHHVSAPAKIEASLRKVMKPKGRTAFPPLSPVPLALYQASAWTK